MDLIATGERKRLTRACDEWLLQLSQIIRTANQVQQGPPPQRAAFSSS